MAATRVAVSTPDIQQMDGGHNSGGRGVSLARCTRTVLRGGRLRSAELAARLVVIGVRVVAAERVAVELSDGT